MCAAPLVAYKLDRERAEGFAPAAWLPSTSRRSKLIAPDFERLARVP
jgi:hypothetical protein